ncbi:MAG TPA: lytic transglycosylase domain-containing protein [Streptosporangiaceae bacterium]|nr:lytic transglycosylase domain-containing protein [Streptosporangiaceae bacterium]
MLGAAGVIVALVPPSIAGYGLATSHDAADASAAAAISTGGADPAAGNAPSRPAASSPAARLSPSAPAGTLRQIILPDLLVVLPGGMTAEQIAQLRAATGVRNMITFAGGEITAGGVRMSVIGVNPAAFRSWVPLETASDQVFWSDLSKGDFVAASDSLELIPGGAYRLVGASTQVVKFGVAAALGLTGVDLVVNQQLSAQLGLAPQVASLISAPGASITTLQAEVGRILGRAATTEVLRSQQLPVATVPAGTQPTTYLELFKAAAADYCPGLSWTVLAAIGQIESADGENDGPSSAGALGPMQFLPSTWQVWGIDAFGQTGPPNIMNPYDAVASAARMLCADGAASGGSALAGAIFDYNPANWYVSEVLALAAEYAADYA